MAVDLEYYGVPAADYREQENRTRLTAAAGQTTFSAPYSVGYVDVYFNGAKLDPFTEFTGTDGANIVLASAAVLGDIVEVISRAQVQVANVYTQQQVNALLIPYFGIATGTGDAQIIVTTPTFTSFVDGMDIKVRTAGVNATTTPTITCNGLGSKTIVSNNGGAALYGSDWAAGSEITLRYNQTLNKFVIIDGQTTVITPAQFLNNNQSVSAAFVQRALGNMSGGTPYSSAGLTLTAANMGQMIDLTSAFTGTVTLPLSSTLTSGASVTVYNGTAGTTTVVASGSDLIWPTSNSFASIGISSGDSVQFTLVNTAWIVSGGVGALSYSKQFGSSLASGGYQKLPGGVIIQWGSAAFSTTQANTNLPIAFPTGGYSVTGTSIAATAYTGLGVSFTSASQISTQCTAGSGTINYVAIGH